MMTTRKWRFFSVVGATAIAFAALLAPQPGDSCCSLAGAQKENAEAKVANKRSVVLNIEGMTCAACTLTVRTALKSLDGVMSATVQLAEKRAVVEYDAAKVTPQGMVEAVGKAGYKASVAQAQKGS